MYQAGLVLEGGGMKGVYTSGVLDYFLERDVMFSSVYGVSAGACNMCSYVSKQKGRQYRISVNYLHDNNYCSARSLLTTGDLFGVEMCYHKIPDVLDPYDYTAFQAFEGKAYSVVTNIETGKAEYMQIKDMKRDIDMIRASASLPFVSRPVEINGGKYLDGGCADCIPIIQSLRDGNKKNVVILTKEVGYRRQASETTNRLMKMYYRKYPKFIKVMKRRHVTYNKVLDFLEEHEQKNHIFVLRPKKPSGIGRIEKDADKLKVLYDLGYEDAKANFDQMMDYLSNVRV